MSVTVSNENRTIPVNASGEFTDLFNNLGLHLRSDPVIPSLQAKFGPTASSGPNENGIACY